MAQPIYLDDPSIHDEERLFRRVHIALIVRDDDTGLARVSSGAFKDRELSINIESLLKDVGESADACLQNHKGKKLVAITAADARRSNQAVCRDPLPEDPSHGLVFGSKNNGRIRENLRAAAVWVIPQAPPLYEEIEAEKRALGLVV